MIMKKLTFLFVCLFAISLAAWADDDKPIRVEQMPQTAQTFIRQHFGSQTVALAKMESDFLSKSYDVIFTNGDKVEFDKKGRWTKLDCEHSQVPVEVIPSAIREYTSKMYPDAKVVKLEKEDRGGYEVELSNGWDVKFDRKLNVIELDK